MSKKNRGSVRIVAGLWRGRQVSFPGNDSIRPTPDRVRETLFNWLREDIAGAMVLDLYSGTGILGIEAISRGASHVKFVDNNKNSIINIEAHLQKFGAAEQASFLCQSALGVTPFLSEDKFDLIFLDPPYGSGLLQQTLDMLLQSNCLKPETIFYCEKGRRDEFVLDDHWDVLKHKKYGAVEVMLLQQKGASNG